MKFEYQARDAAGLIVSGIIEAPDQKLAMERLRNIAKLSVFEIHEKVPSQFDRFIDRINIFKPKVKSKELVIFSRQLSTLVGAGVPIVQGLGILEAQAETAVFRMVLQSIKTDIEAGLGIADAMKKHPKVFSTLYVSMIRAGEVGGILDTILERLSAYLEQAENLKGKVKSAMMYPLVVGLIAGVVTVFLMVFVIPTFKNIFGSFGAALPFPTRVVIAISDFLKSQIVAVILFPFAAWFAFKKLYATEKGRAIVDFNILRMPVFGILLKKVAIAKFTRTLGTLIRSGVPILQGLETVAATAGNVVIERAVMDCRESVKEGGRLVEPLKKSSIFPPMVVQMIGVGEETGSLDAMLVRIADFYDQEVDTAVKGLTSMIEPIIIVVMGVVIGGIVIAMFLPMLSLGQLAGDMG
ncbi:MAG: type II secretion system F family protein [Elusimicrobiaceae bacterium]|nr:type II secretion system F family protein [Elusimicrobiaceae bacterium]